MDIKDTLKLSLHGDERSVKDLCDLFRRMALAYLKTKIKRDHFLTQQVFGSMEDLAWDCIADLFKKEKGRFIQLDQYLNEKEIDQWTESQLTTKLRQLVFSKVNDGIYRNYKTFDPSLSKIIRNLKRTLETEKVEGAYYNRITREIEFEEKKKLLPPISDDLLEIKLSSTLNEIRHTVDAIEQLKKILLREPEYASRFNLTAYAILLRKLYAYQMEVEEEEIPMASRYQRRELLGFIDSGIMRQNEQMYHTYVRSGKVHEEHFERYIKVVRDILKTEYLEETGKEGYFEHFEHHFPEVTYDRYRKEYRKLLEYLVKKIRDQLILDLKREEDFSNLRTL